MRPSRIIKDYNRTYAIPYLCSICVYFYVLYFLQQVLYAFATDSHSVIETVTEDIMQVLCAVNLNVSFNGFPFSSKS